MIDGLKSYPAIEDSGVPWLGEVPRHWEVRKLRQCVTVMGGMTPSMENQRFWDGSIPWVTPKDMKRTAIDSSIMHVTDVALRETSLRLVGARSILMVVRGMILARRVPFAWTTVPVTVNQDMKALRPMEGVDAEYLARQLDSAQEAFVPLIDEAGHGTRRLPTERWRDLAVLVPPICEQQRIVCFLDHADRRIRRYIRAKQKLIKLLEEKKQAIIHRAVTRGLDPNVRLKPSGVKWLGEVPEHWKIARLKEVTTPIEQGWSPQCDAQPAGDDEWGVLKVGCVNGDVFDERQNKKLPPPLRPVAGLEVRDGDILVSRANTRELLGLAAVAIRPRSKLLLCDKLFRFRVKDTNVDAQFLVHAIRQRTSRAQIESSTNGASDSMQNVGQGVVRNLLLSLPPLDEQMQVLNALQEQTTEQAAGISCARRQIDLLREYRTRLIADVVTGKLDVREAAARLPDEAEEPEPLDEADALGEADEDLAGGVDAAIEEAEA